MSAQHTPAPWILDTRMSSQGFWRVLGRLKDGSSEYHVANVVDANDSPQNDANARLIAAAPELLEIALESAAECGDCDFGNGATGFEHDGKTCRGCGHIRAVLAKAGG